MPQIHAQTALILKSVVIALAITASCGLATLAWSHAGAAPDPGRPTVSAAPDPVRPTVVAVPLGQALSAPAGAPDPLEPAQKIFSWSAGPGPVHPRAGPEMVLLADGTILALGGEDENYGHQRYHDHMPASGPPPLWNRPERYEPGRQRWSAVAGMLEGRRDLSYTATRLADGKVLVAGGGRTDRQCELFDPVTGSWAPTAALGHPRDAFHRLPAALLADGGVLVAVRDGKGYTCELFDPQKETWSAIPPMSGYRSSLLVLRDGTVLASGGTSCERYEPATRTWRRTGAMVTPRFGHTATVLADGQVLITGGDAWADQAPLASCELYDPRTGIWSATAAMPRLRLDYAVASLPSGHVLAIGGKFWEKCPDPVGTDAVPFDGIEETLTDSCLEYAPETRSWSAAPALTHARDNLTATALPDGRIVVVGGQDRTDIEIYAPAPAAAHGGSGGR